MTTKPTPLDDFRNCILAATDGRSPEAVFNECSPDTMIYERLVAFLQSPAVLALSDPALRAAAEVVIGRLPDLMEMIDVGTASALVCDAAGTALYEAHDAAKAAKEAK